MTEAVGAVGGCGVTEAVGHGGCVNIRRCRCNGATQAANAVVGGGGAEAAGDAGRSAAIPIIGGWTSLGESGGAEAAGDAGDSAVIPIIGGWTSLRESAGP